MRFPGGSRAGDQFTHGTGIEGADFSMLLEGKAEFVQQIDGEERRTPVGPGATMINPAGVWHTADVTEPLRAIYITPCPGTQHRPR